MELEKNKVYKCVHTRTHFQTSFPRDYIIFAPSKNMAFDDTRLGRATRELKPLCTVECEFLVDFYGETNVSATTTVFEDCHFEGLNIEDLKDIRRCLPNTFKYNRRLKMLIQVEK